MGRCSAGEGPDTPQQVTLFRTEAGDSGEAVSTTFWISKQYLAQRITHLPALLYVRLRLKVVGKTTTSLSAAKSDITCSIAFLRKTDQLARWVQRVILMSRGPR